MLRLRLAAVVAFALVASIAPFSPVAVLPAGAEDGRELVCSGETVTGFLPAHTAQRAKYEVWVPSGATVTFEETVTVLPNGNTPHVWFHSENLVNDLWSVWVGPQSQSFSYTRPIQVLSDYHYNVDLFTEDWQDAKGVLFSARVIVTGGDGSQGDGCPRPRPLYDLEALGKNEAEPHLCSCHGHAGDPVDTATGNFHEGFTDMSLGGRGSPLAFSRAFNSLDSWRDGALGRGWSSPALMSLAEDELDGRVTIIQEGGARVYFFPDGAGGYTAPGRVVATLTRDTVDHTWALSRQNRDVLTFEDLTATTARLESVSDVNGETTTFAYDGSGHLSTVTDPANRTLTVAWTASHITQVVDDQASPPRSVGYGYDANGDLSTVTDVEGGVWTFGYDSSHRLISIDDPRPGDVPLENEYDDFSRTTKQTRPVVVNDQAPRVTVFDYTSTPGATTVTDPEGNVTVDYYTDGLLVKQTKGFATVDAASWLFEYDPVSLGLTTIVGPTTADPDIAVPAGHPTWTYTYDVSGNQTASRDPAGRGTAATFDAYNDPTAVSQGTWSGSTFTPEVTTTYFHDDAGHPWLLTKVSTPLVGTPDVQTVRYNHGDAGHPGDVTSVVDARAKTWVYGYDAYGDRDELIDPVQNKTTWVYNADGWPLSTVSPRGNANGGALASQFTTSVASYNRSGQPTTVVDPLGKATTYGYDAVGNQTSVTDRNGHQTSFEFDYANDQTAVHRADGTYLRTDYHADATVWKQRDGADKSTIYNYDHQGRLVAVADELGRATTYGYDPAGNRTTIQDPGGDCASSVGCTTFGFDAANQLRSVAYSDGVTPGVSNIDYDFAGRRVAMTDGTGSQSWDWDSLGRLESHTNGASTTVGYTYELDGRPKTITSSAGTVTRGYDGAGRWTSVTDWAGRQTSFGYDADSDLVSETFPNGVVSTLSPDRNGATLGVAHTKGTTTFASLAYTRDDESQAKTMAQGGLPGAASETYGYTTLDQLKTVNGATRYNYDPADNPTTFNTTAQSFDDANQVSTVAHPGAATSVVYDPKGQRTNWLESGGWVKAYGYDQAGRVVSYDSARKLYVSGGSNSFSVAVNDDGSPYTAGSDAYGQLGNGGTSVDSPDPTAVAGSLPDISGIAAGYTHTVAVASGGSVWAWGRNDKGQLGNGTTTDAQSPVQTQISAGVGFSGASQVAAGEGYTLIRKPDGTVWATGDNAYGVLGQGNTTSKTRPVQVKQSSSTMLTNVASISAGRRHVVAVKVDGTVWTWGDNTSGQLGNGTTSSTPTKYATQTSTPSGFAGIAMVATEASHTLALKADGTVWAWGSNAYGQLGDNTLTTRPTPKQVPGLAAVFVAAGGSHSLAIRADGTIAAFGANVKGQLGDGTTTDSKVPVSVDMSAVAGRVTSVAAGSSTSLAGTADGRVYAWADLYGQVGDGTTAVGYPSARLSDLEVGHSDSYGYDGDGLRTSDTDNGATTPFTYDTSGGMALVVGYGTSSYVYGPQGTPVERVDGSGTPSWYHTDHLGSVVALTDTAGAVVGTASYGPYGARATTGATTRFGFGGAWLDTDTGLYWMRARIYDPATGQFLTRDPLDALTRSAYGYVYDNPLNGTDPTGLSDCHKSHWYDPGKYVDCAAKQGHEVAHTAGEVAKTTRRHLGVCSVYADEGCVSYGDEHPALRSALGGVAKYAAKFAFGCAAGGTYGFVVGGYAGLVIFSEFTGPAGAVVGCGLGGILYQFKAPGAPGLFGAASSLHCILGRLE